MAASVSPASYGDVFRLGEFRALWSLVVLSRLGTQFARVALALLAFQRTGSPAVTALVYALTLLPAIVGGSLLGGLADRFPRRELLVVCACSRAALVALIAVPGIPLTVLCGLVFVVQTIESCAKAAQMALLPDVLGDRAYSTGVAAHSLTSQVVDLIAFPVGGVLVGAAGPGGALGLTAAGFAFMGLVARTGLRPRPAARAGAALGRGGDPGRGGVGRLILRDPLLRGPLALATLAAFYVVPEVLAAPYAAELRLGTTRMGVLMAAMPVGNVLGVFLLTRFVPERARLRLMGPLAVAAALPLVLSAIFAGFVPSLLLWGVVGALSSYQVTANTEFVRVVPRDRRGAALGLASSILVTSQGAGMVLGGLLAEHAGVSLTFAVAGAGGCLVGLVPALDWHRARPDLRRRDLPLVTTT
ncbi:MFS transporter [Microbispora sp. ATCC PTA-5024]|uniref:MFS transporter n=1 Tax=Microbispora sp. ATCC PTA-5024 TaxID=316330 RepID=UPI0003DD8950|nr:MFS transporter [Microbispora sp. ATCC PTA-5024]ETK31779.1 hypothetical protein MPTA5024_33360 [Microbispora sp. ATCC PTA-5024]